MSDIPDKVISDAVKVVPATQAGVGSARMVRQVVTRAAPVIAAWAARQERVRIREAIADPEALEAAHEVGLRLANSDGPKEVPAGDYLGGSAMVAGILLAGLDTALAALDRDGSDTREDGK